MLSGCIMEPPAIYIPDTHPPRWLLSELFMEWTDRPVKARLYLPIRLLGLTSGLA